MSERVESELTLQKKRIGIHDYAMMLAYVASLRSEDPYRKVGAVALDKSNRIIATAYNGLAAGYNAEPGFWDDRDARRKYMIHAEVNLCSLFVRGHAKLVACTTKPCTSCIQMLCAYDIKEILYADDYPASEADVIAERYGVSLIHVPIPKMNFSIE
jgi:dCMP deaminase